METKFKTKVELNSFCMKGEWCPYFELEQETIRFEGWKNAHAEVLIYKQCKNIQICKHSYDLAQKVSEEE